MQTHILDKTAARQTETEAERTPTATSTAYHFPEHKPGECEGCDRQAEAERLLDQLRA